MKTRIVAAALALGVIWSCGHDAADNQGKGNSEMDKIATEYVKLMLDTGQYDSDFIDAYYGPEELRPDSGTKTDSLPRNRFEKQIGELLNRINGIDSAMLNELLGKRKEFLHKQLIAAQTRLRILAGENIPFDEESRLLYDAVAPTHDVSYFEGLIKKLDNMLPGTGPISERLNKYREDFVIPKERLSVVFKAAVAECRKRTLAHIDLPDDENFTIEFVTDKPWSGYNWYKGNSFSLIQLNTDLPIFIERAVDVGAHEAYPGHHLFNALLEKNLVRKRNWVEFSVYPLFTPHSLIAEGTANYGKEVVFTPDERLKFETEVLFPLAGLDASRAAEYYKVVAMADSLNYAGNEAARNYLDGKSSAEQAIDWLVKYRLFSPERAAQRIKFIEKYRSYVINYNLGEDIVRKYVESKGGTSDKPERRWQLFEELLSTPLTASALAVD